MSLEFEKNEDGTRRLAIYVSQLVREGVVFTIAQDERAVRVTLTGGF